MLVMRPSDLKLSPKRATARWFRTVFDNPDFAGRNIITAEIEKIIEELASHSLSRAEFLKRLDRFYLAIGQPLPPSMEVLTVSREDI